MKYFAKNISVVLLILCAFINVFYANEEERKEIKEEKKRVKEMKETEAEKSEIENSTFRVESRNEPMIKFYTFQK